MTVTVTCKLLILLVRKTCVTVVMVICKLLILLSNGRECVRPPYPLIPIPP